MSIEDETWPPGRRESEKRGHAVSSPSLMPVIQGGGVGSGAECA